MVYEWKRNFFDADAQRVGEELSALSFRDARSVVKAARKKGSELHKCFEWDDAKAGEAYREEQARLVMRMLVTVIDQDVEVGEPLTIKVRAFESVRFNNPQGEADKTMAYIPIREALTDPELRAQVRSRLESTIAEAQTTAEHYTYLVPEFAQVGEKLKDARAAIRA